MLSLPDELSHQFNAELDQGRHPENIKHFYRKWLRYYWDFCQKYQHDPFHPSSLPLFLNKLAQKRQSNQQREQAGQAIKLFIKFKLQLLPGILIYSQHHAIRYLYSLRQPRMFHIERSRLNRLNQFIILIINQHLTITRDNLS